MKTLLLSLALVACGGTYVPLDASPEEDATPDAAQQGDASPDVRPDVQYGQACVTDNSTSPPGEHIQCYDINGNATWEWNVTGGEFDWTACNQPCILGTKCRERGDAGFYFQGTCQ